MAHIHGTLVWTAELHTFRINTTNGNNWYCLVLKFYFFYCFFMLHNNSVYIISIASRSVQCWKVTAHLNYKFRLLSIKWFIFVDLCSLLKLCQQLINQVALVYTYMFIYIYRKNNLQHRRSFILIDNFFSMLIRALPTFQHLV